MHNDLEVWKANWDCVSNTKIESPTGKALSPTRGHARGGVLWANGDCNDRLSFFLFQRGRDQVRQRTRSLRFVDNQNLPRQSGGGKDLCR